MKNGVLCGHGSTTGGRLPHGTWSVLGSWCGKQLFLLPVPAAFHSPLGVFRVRLKVSSGAVSGHQVVFFTLSVLTTLSYRRSQAEQLDALWPSPQLEHKEAAIHCGYFNNNVVFHFDQRYLYPITQGYN